MYRYSNDHRSCCCGCPCNNTSNDPLENTCNNNTNSITSNNSMSGCGASNEVFPTNPMLAQSYVPIQFMDKTFTPYCGLKNGTMFPELVTTYNPGQSMMTLDYLRMNNGGVSNV